MGVTGVNGNTNTSQTQGTQQPPKTLNTQSGTVGTSTGAPEPTDEGAPVVGDASDEGTTGGDIPSPDSDPGAYAAGLQQKDEDRQQLLAWREQLEVLADRGDATAIALIGKIDQALQAMGLGNEYDIEQFEELYDEYIDYMPDEDLDGDGVKNKDDADIDGDAVTNEAEAANGTSAYSIDSDGDGITDYGELWIRQHNYDYTWMDPNNPDANHNGIIDGKELPTSIQVDNNGQPIIVGGQPSTSTSSDGTTGTSSSSLIWGPPTSDAQTATWGDTVDASAGDVVITLAGENVEFSEDGDGNTVLTNKDTGETITIENSSQGRVFIEGEAGDVSTNNLSGGALSGMDNDGDGYADGGFHFGSGISLASVQNNYDPFNGSMPIDETNSTDEEIVYNADGGSGTFQVPDSMGGNAVEVTFEGDDVIVTVKDGTNGEAIKSFRLKGGKDEVESGAISFQLGDEGTYFYTEGQVTVTGGKGNDMISVGSGSKAYGGAGNDYMAAVGSDAAGVTLDGQDGDDILEGGDGADTLVGGKGFDAAYSGASEGDTFDMGDGNDIAIVSNTNVDSNYNLNMGSGVDMSNDTNTDDVESGSVDVRMDDLDGMSKFLEDESASALGDLAEALDKAEDIANLGAQMAADSVKDAFLAYLGKKRGEIETSYGSDHGDGFSGDGNVPPPSDEEEGEGP
ncbi:MAG TPA: hypothetical protein VFX30_09675 [bacterium]|nr:hypothetical protein [bacterium]